MNTIMELIDDSTLNQLAMIIYMLATGIFLYEYVAKKDASRRSAAIPVLVTGFVIQTGALLLRWVVSYQMGYGHAPLSNRYEAFIFFGWSIVGFFLVFQNRMGLRRLGGFIVPLGAIGIAATTFIPGTDVEIKPLMPALQSNWLLFHVVTCFIAYSAFTVAFVAGITYLIKRNRSKSSKERHAGGTVVLDNIMYRTVMVGFLLLTLGIISGSAWAYNAWGRYWGWDPKEVWSLITWIAYAVFLHARITKNWAGQRMAWVSVIGFLFVLVTFLGVNYLTLFKGLHSYA